MGISTEVAATLYVLSGICQPLLVSAMKKAGLTNASAQLYMFFYYAGPSLFLITFCLPQRLIDNSTPLPSLRVILFSSLLSLFDIMAQVLNYTGAGLAGATIFAIVYSSVTVWTAVWNRIFLHRLLTTRQWTAISIVFVGLCVTAWNSTETKKAEDSTTSATPVAWGTVLILLGSCMHGGFYVMSDALMLEGQSTGRDGRRHFLYPREMTALQSAVACIGLGLWQVIYTRPRWQALLGDPMGTAGTTPWTALRLLLAFAAANTVHASSFYFTIANYPGKSTSAGVFKGLQAVLVFVVAHWMFCDPTTAPEMCWSGPKMLSLVMVVSGVILFNLEVNRHGNKTMVPLRATEGGSSQRYDSIDATVDVAGESSSSS